MVQIIRTEEYASWILSLRDDRPKAKIALRVDRLALGNPGDVKPVGGGLSEMRIDHGPGYRVYYGKHGDSIICSCAAEPRMVNPGTSRKPKRSSKYGRQAND